MTIRVAFGGRIARREVTQRLEAMPGIAFTAVGDLTELPPLVSTSDVLVVSDPRGAEGAVLAAALRAPDSSVRWIQCVSAGVDGLLGPGIPQSIVLTNQGGAVAPTVAEHAMALLLGLSRQIGPIYERSKQGTWDKEFTPPLFALEGRTLAIVGFGNVGREIARRAKAFEMRVLGLARSPKADPSADAMAPLDDLHSVLAQADAVAVCLALGSTTRHLMNAAAFAACKPGSLLINVSRGETVDPIALRAALESGALGGAAIDVTETEPLPAGDPLWGAPNLIISPHVAGGGGAFTGRRIAATVADNIERYQRNEPLRHVVSRT
jgi:phosphoglycerate dehydrogenase-like enzyme